MTDTRIISRDSTQVTFTSWDGGRTLFQYECDDSKSPGHPAKYRHHFVRALEEAARRDKPLPRLSAQHVDFNGGMYLNIHMPDARLQGATFRNADLSNANLRGADLSGVDFSHAVLFNTDLTFANVAGAWFEGASLQGAKLGVNAGRVALERLKIVPEEGGFVGWKQCSGGDIVKLWIPENAKRSNATGRKCRAEFAEVLDIFDIKGNRSPHTAYSVFNDTFEYKIGRLVKCDTWHPDRFQECAGGIHFFLTRAEAEAWQM
jgi:hypothetical protein